MARVAFFVESLPPSEAPLTQFAWEMARSLADQQHDVRVFSTYEEASLLPPPHPRIEVFRPFRSWSWLELPKILPLLIPFRPEVLHFIQPHREALQGWSNLMSLLPQVGGVFGEALTVASFFDIDERTLGRHRVLFRTVDALTVANERQRATVVRHDSQSLVEVVPLSWGSGSTESTDFQGELSSVLEDSFATLHDRCSRLIWIPGPMDQHLDPLFTFACIRELLTRDPTVGVVLSGGWGTVPVRIRHRGEECLADRDLSGRWLQTGPLPVSVEAYWLRRSHCALLAPLDETRLNFSLQLRQVQTAGLPIVMSLEQAAADPIGWMKDENAWIPNRDPHAIADAVFDCFGNRDKRSRITSNAAELSQRRVMDLPGNILSRLYVRAGIERRSR